MVQQVKITYTGSLAPGACSVMHFADEAGVATVSAAIASWMDFFKDRWATNVTAGWDGGIRQLDTVTGALTGFSVGTPVTADGEATTERTADNVALWVRLLTDTIAGGRRLTGGFYIGGVTEGAIGPDGNLNATTIMGLNGSVSAWLEDPAIVRPVIWSRTHGVAAVVSQGFSGQMISSQRGRRG